MAEMIHKKKFHEFEGCKILIECEENKKRKKKQKKSFKCRKSLFDFECKPFLIVETGRTR